MRFRIVSLVATGALLAAVGASFAPAAGAGTSGRPVAAAHRQAVVPKVPAITILWNQNNNDTGVGITSQDFTDSGFDIYDGSGADDFVVPAGQKWLVKGVAVTGVYYNCSVCGPADAEEVTFYADAGGSPGAPIASRTATAAEGGGSFKIPLSPGVALTAGTYWVGVVIKMAFFVGGQWGWELRSPSTGSLGYWENPGDGFATGCVTWAVVSSCVGYGDDWMFALVGKKGPA